jgi:hypothetical protein
VWTALALAAAACHRRPLQPTDGGPTDAVADGDAQDALACGEGVSDPAGFTIEGVSNGPGATHVGRALVDESTPAGLVLTLLDETGNGTDHPRLILRGTPTPGLPVGRVAWLAYAVSNADTFGLRESSWTLSVQDVKGGTLLFGTAHQSPSESLTPFPFGALTTLCAHGDCPRTTELALAVPGASPETIPNGGSATLMIGANAYRLWVHAQAQVFAFDHCDAATFFPLQPLVLTYVANDLADLAAGLAAPPQ